MHGQKKTSPFIALRPCTSFSNQGGIYHEPTSRFYFFLNFPHLCKPPVLKKVWVVVGRKMADYYEQRGHRTGIYDGLERANWTAVTVVSSQRFELLQLAG